jgi:hypothetical protein
LSKGELNKGVVISKEEARIKIAQSLQYRNRKIQEGTSPTKQRSNSRTDGGADVASMQSDVSLGFGSYGAWGPLQPTPIFAVHNSRYLPSHNSHPSYPLTSLAANGHMQWIAPPPPPPSPPIPMSRPSFCSLPMNASVASDTVTQNASNSFSATTTTTVVSNEEIRWALGVSSVPPPEIAIQLVGISNHSQRIPHNHHVAADETEPQQHFGDDSEDTAIGVAFTDLPPAQPPSAAPQPPPPPLQSSPIQSWPLAC